MKSRIGEGLRRNWKWIAVYILFQVSQVALFFGMDAGMDNRGLLVCLIGMISANVIFGFAIWQQFNKLRLKRRLEEEELLLEMRRKTNEEMERQKEQMEKRKESYQRQLQELLALAQRSPQEARSRLQMFQQELNDTKIMPYCGNEIVNAVVSKYDRLCGDRQIDFEKRLVMDGLQGIEPVHLCSVFSNLLDNALHACEVLKAERRWIKVNAGMQGDYVRISVLNSAGKEEKTDDSRDHYGLKILADIARLYEGSFSSKLENEEYHAVIVLMRHEKRDEK